MNFKVKVCARTTDTCDTKLGQAEGSKPLQSDFERNNDETISMEQKGTELLGLPGLEILQTASNRFVINFSLVGQLQNFIRCSQNRLVLIRDVDIDELSHLCARLLSFKLDCSLPRNRLQVLNVALLDWF